MNRRQPDAHAPAGPAVHSARTAATAALGLALLLAGAPPARGQDQAPPPAAEAPAAQPQPDCSAPEHRQFDFWIGDWEVTRPDGTVAGHNRIEPTLDGCVLHEHWTGAGGSKGESFNVYDRTRGRWHQTWVDDDGLLLQIDGGLVDGAMVLSGETVRPDGGTALQRITWTPLPGGAVRQHWEASRDGGASWRTLFDGTYRKRAAGGSG